MASIEKRTRSDDTTSYRVKWRERGTARSETFAKEADAKRFRGMVDAAGQRYPEGWIPGQGVDAITSGLTVREWAERAIAARTGITQGTRDKYAAILEQHLYPALGTVPLDGVNRERAALWLNGLIATVRQVRGKPDPDGRTLSPKTVANIHGLVSSIWKDAIADEVVAGNPFAGLRLPEDGADVEEMVFLTHEEFASLYSLTPERHQLLIRTLVETGLRWSEATALQVRHLTAKGVVVNQAWKSDRAGRLTLGGPKTEAGRRTVSIPDDLADALTVHVAGKRGDAWVFATPDGHPLRNGTFHTRVWIPLMLEVEPLIGKRPRPHDLRHTHVSWLIRNGVDIYRIMARVGHTSVVTTQGRYGHLYERDETDVKVAAASGVGASQVAPIRRRRAAKS